MKDNVIEFVKDKWKVLVFVLVLLILLLISYLIFKKVSFSKNEYKGTYYKVVYDDTWKSKVKNDELTLTHKKNKGTIRVYHKVLADDMIDVELEDIISDILSSLTEQNKNYKMISKVHNIEKFDSYQVMYEHGNDESLVSIYKQDNILIFIVYNNTSDYFDIALDSVDSILDSLEIYSGIR